MNEQRWLTSDEPAEMLDWFCRRALDGPLSRKSYGCTDRKLRLFAVACHELFPGTSAAFYRKARDTRGADDDFIEHLLNARTLARVWVSPGMLSGNPLTPERNRPEDAPLKATLLREVFGNPFRRKPVSSEWLSPTVTSLAQAAYESPLPSGMLDPFRLALLADALEEAGCVGEECERCEGYGRRWKCKRCRGIWFLETVKDATCPACPGSACQEVLCEDCEGGIIPHPFLAHLRSPGPHVRGCAIIDLILGLE